MKMKDKYFYTQCYEHPHIKFLDAMDEEKNVKTICFCDTKTGYIYGKYRKKEDKKAVATFLMTIKEEKQ